jgi:hypothetical protein
MQRRKFRSIRHWVLQLLWPLKAPSIQVTDAARAQISRVMSGLEYEPVVAIMLGSDVLPSGAVAEPRWMVAYYDLDTRPSGRVTQIAGIPFVFLQTASSRLNGATLDYQRGHFVVEGAT